MAQTVTCPIVQPGSRLLMHDVDWTTYNELLAIFCGSPTVRLTYDRGILEITRSSPTLQFHSRIIVFLIQTLAEEWNLPLKAGGSVTMRRKPKRAGLEADESFWLANAPRMAGRRQLNLHRDPPPDLAIEVEVRRSPLNRMSIYARLGVPEVWRLRKSELTFLILDGKKYVEAATSLAFPGLTPKLVEKFVHKAAEAGDILGVLREFRAATRKCRGK